MSAAPSLKSKFSTCAQIEGDLARLDCFDQLAKKNKLNGPMSIAANSEGTGNWQVSRQVNPIDDTETVTLRLESSTGKSRFNRIPELILRCKSDKTEMYINWSDFLGNKVVVLERLDKEKAFSTTWSISSDKKASFYPRSPISRIRKMMNGTVYIAQITPYSESPVTATFKLEGLNVAIKPLSEVCHWGAIKKNMPKKINNSEKDKAVSPVESRRALVQRLISLQEKYKQSIQRKVKENWVKPPGVSGDIGCDIVVTQIPSGDVVDVHVKRCTVGGDLLRRSVEAAVLKSSPLPGAPDPAVFDRTINLFFRPEG